MKRIWLLGLAVLSAAWLFAGASFAAEGQGLQAPGSEIIIAGEKNRRDLPMRFTWTLVWPAASVIMTVNTRR